MKDADITSALGVGQSTVERIRKRCVEEGVESALNTASASKSWTARLIAMACGEPPEELDPEAGLTSWSSVR